MIASTAKSCNTEFSECLRNVHHGQLSSPSFVGWKEYEPVFLFDCWAHISELSVFKFIHSFIIRIYIAPLLGYYSEALPTPARLKRAVLRVEQNAPEWTLGILIAVPMEAHSKPRGLPLRLQEPGESRYFNPITPLLHLWRISTNAYHSLYTYI